VLGLLPDERLQRRCGEHSPRQPQATDDGAPIAFFGEITRVDRRHVAGPVRLGLDIAARQRPHLPGAGAEPRCLLELADLATLEAAGRESDFDIGCGRLLEHFDRGGYDRGAVGQHALAGEEPAHHLAGQRQAAPALVGGLGADNRIGDARAT